MAQRRYEPAEVQDRLWQEIEKHQIGMLGLPGDALHFLPMTAFAERHANQIWFYSYNDTALARAAEGGGPAAFIFQTGDVQACVDGVLAVDRDPERIDRHWNTTVAAWFPEGKNDPRLTLLRFDCTEASVWLTDAGPIKYAWEIARAATDKRPPDVGGRADIGFH